jgi:predicted nucleic acid-binding protein
VSVKRIVIDASVALKWRLDDEEAKDEAKAMLQDFPDGRIELIAPGLFDYEVTNALKVAVVRGRIGEQDALNAITAYQSLGIERIDFRPLLVATFQLEAQANEQRDQSGLRGQSQKVGRQKVGRDDRQTVCATTEAEGIGGADSRQPEAIRRVVCTVD